MDADRSDAERNGRDDERAPYDPMPHGPAEVGVGPWEGPWPSGEQYDATLLAEGDRRNVVDRYRYWTMSRDRRRPGRPPARLPRGDRELAARLQHRHDRPLRERVPGPRGAHRRQPAVEPAGRDGHRPLPARRPPRGRALAGGVPARPRRRAGRPVGHRQPARLTAPRDHRGAAPGVLPVRPGGPGAVRPAREACDATFSIAQFGSTRSINASAAAAIAMHAWVRAHADLSGDGAWRG